MDLGNAKKKKKKKKIGKTLLLALKSIFGVHS